MRGARRLYTGVLVGAIIFGLFSASFVPSRVNAAINNQINFQGKLTNPDGTNVTNGSYSIRFRIYDNATNDAANACLPGSNSCKFEDTQTLTVTDGIFSYILGSNGLAPLPGSVDFNNAGLYIGVKVGTDSEMTPRIQLTAAPYAFNSSSLGGIADTGYVKLGQTSGATGQADASNNPSIYVNKTSATGNILELQKAGTDVFAISNTGNITATGTFNSNTFTSAALQFGTSGTATVQSAATFGLNVTGHNNSVISTDAGTLTLQGFGGAALTTANATGATTGVTIDTGDSTTAGNTGSVAISSGNATSGTAGNVSLDNGTSTTGTPQLNLGSANARAITLGNTNAATTVATIVGASASAFSVQGASSAVYMRIDSSANRLYVGNPTADGTAFLLIQDYKNTTGDPGGVNGGSYYNSANNKFRCFQNSIWSDCGNGFNTITKAADQASPLSTITFQNDSALVFPVSANTTYVFDAWIPVDDSNATADLKYTFTTPAGSVLTIMTSYSTAAATQVLCNITASGQTCANTTFNNANHFIQVRGHVTVAGTAGNVQFQFAQNTSTAVAFPVIKKGATLSWHQSN